MHMLHIRMFRRKEIKKKLKFINNCNRRGVNIEIIENVFELERIGKYAKLSVRNENSV